MAEFAPLFDPNNFNSPGIITNPYFPLTRGTTLVYEGAEEIIRFQVTYDTRTVAGVTCVVVLDQAYSTNDTPADLTDDFLIEKTYDYFAQDVDGNVWYFGEAVKNYNTETGKFEDKDGSWLSGVKGALPGVIMMANPVVGTTYNQENAPGVAEDFAEVLGIGSSLGVPYGFFTNVLTTFDGSHLDPELQEEKSYAFGVGFIQAKDVSVPGGDVEQLVRIEFDGTSKTDIYTGSIGTDWLRGHAGDDMLSGGDGNDIITGGVGADVLCGDAGNDTFVYTDAKESLTFAKRDIIFGFLAKNADLSVADKIDLSEIDANTKLRDDQPFAFIGAGAFTGTAGQLRFDGSLLEGDRNGDKVGDFFVEVYVVGVSPFTVENLILS